MHLILAQVEFVYHRVPVVGIQPSAVVGHVGAVFGLNALRVYTHKEGRH